MVRDCETPDGRLTIILSPEDASGALSSVKTRPFTAETRPPRSRPERVRPATEITQPGCGILPSSPTLKVTTRSLLLVRIPHRAFRFASDCRGQPIAVISS